MQVPPEQPIGPGGYPRPAGYGQPDKFSGDLPVGIILIVLNAIGACIGGAAVIGGGFISGMGDAVKAQMAKQGQTMSDAELHQAGSIALIFGGVWLLASIVSIVGSVGILKGLRWGFTTCFAVGVLLVIVSAVTINVIGILCGLFPAIYCGLRLFGNVGPRPA